MADSLLVPVLADGDLSGVETDVDSGADDVVDTVVAEQEQNIFIELDVAHLTAIRVMWNLL